MVEQIEPRPRHSSTSRRWYLIAPTLHALIVAFALSYYWYAYLAYDDGYGSHIDGNIGAALGLVLVGLVALPWSLPFFVLHGLGLRMGDAVWLSPFAVLNVVLTWCCPGPGGVAADPSRREAGQGPALPAWRAPGLLPVSCATTPTEGRAARCCPLA